MTLGAVLCLAAAILRFNPAVEQAEASVQDIASSMTGVYVSLRFINAALSAAQEIQIGASVGAQANIQPLKILEPVDDTVERVADAVFAVAIGAAVATVGLRPIATLGLVALGLGLAGMALALAIRRPPPWLEQLSQRVVRLGGAVALVLPIVVTLGLEIGDAMTEAQAQEARAVLDRVATEAQILIGQNTGTDGQTDTAPAETLLGRLGESLSAAGGAVDGAVAALRDYTEAAGVFREEATALFQATLTLIAVFLLRSLVLPVLLFWAALALLRRAFES